MSATRENYNWRGALFSYVRMLILALTSALAPMFTGVDDFPTGRAVLIAVIAATLLVTANFFGSWETRYGTPPNPDSTGLS